MVAILSRERWVKMDVMTVLYILLADELFTNAYTLNTADGLLIRGSGVGGAVRFLVVGTIGKEERPPRGQLWMEQYLISLKYWPM